MKRYLWTAVAVLFVNANASENPFALEENLLKLDSEQEMLISELSKIAEAREDAELDAEDDEMDAELEKEANAKEAPARKKKAEGEASSVVDAALDAEDDDIDAELEEDAKKYGLTLDELEKAVNAEEAPVKKKKTEEAALKIAQEKAAQAKADKEKAEQARVQKEADEKAKLAAQARETERREVAAYEKQRAAKLAKKAEAEAKPEVAYTVQMWKDEQSVGIDLEAEQRAAKENADTGYVNAVKEMDAPEGIATSKPVVEKTVAAKVQTEKTEMPEEKPVEEVTLADGDIDVEAEKRAAKKAADAAYLEAVREMDQED